METCALHDKARIEAFLRKNVYLHIYSIGDLDDFFWHKTIWYGLKGSGQIQAIAMLYTEPPLPTLHAMGERHEPMAELIRSIFHLLPTRFHAHLSPGLDDVDCSQVVPLTTDALDEMHTLYKDAYPGNWFDPRMLETGQYFGVRKDDKLVSAAGVHVYSQEYKVASLGNVVTHPDYRSSGLGKSTTARLCQSLAKNVDHIGLNVAATNAAAMALYEKLGFEIVAPYYECMIAM
jgi:RimJ/RimL family protein N-acetyltransferase